MRSILEEPCAGQAQQKMHRAVNAVLTILSQHTVAIPQVRPRPKNLHVVGTAGMLRGMRDLKVLPELLQSCEGFGFIRPSDMDGPDVPCRINQRMHLEDIDDGCNEIPTPKWPSVQRAWQLNLRQAVPETPLLHDRFLPLISLASLLLQPTP